MNDIFRQIAKENGTTEKAVKEDVYKRQTQVWAYIGELVFNMLVLVGAVKMSDRIIREMMGL